MTDAAAFLAEHRRLTRRYFLSIGAGGLAAAALSPNIGWSTEPPAEPTATPPGAAPADESDEVELGAGITLASYLTRDAKFYDVSRGEPLPHSLPEEKRLQVGLTRDTWRLEVESDADHPVRLRKPLTKAKGTALDFAALLDLGERHAVRFVKAMTCLNLGCPLGVGLWEGVPLREVVWLTQPDDELRRVYFDGYHNEVPEQLFRSSLPIGRVFEDPFDLPPVILCYKLNGEWLSPERGGPVRVVVPEHYGFKSIKWLNRVVLTNLPHANDTYAEQGNDIDSPMKTFAATIDPPRKFKAHEPIPVAGYAQVGMGGLAKVQAWLEPEGATRPAGDRHFNSAPWLDMTILPPPDHWGGELLEGKLPMPTHGFDTATGRPQRWPLRFAVAHWAGLLPAAPPGKYVLRCRTVDDQGHGQPLPRPLRKSGHATIEQVTVEIE
jgi:DMSO/TMAO reductase YedYZ molybdopterin-dependent catalytic subunit